jgi:hypothetical protein
LPFPAIDPHDDIGPSEDACTRAPRAAVPGVIQIGRSEYGERGETRPFILSLQAYILLVVRRLSSPGAPCEEER